MAAAEGSALTGVAWSAAPDAAPAGWTVITATVEGTPANLGKGFGNKGGGFLCVSTGGAQASPGSVVTDVQVLSDRTPHPPGYTRVPEFPESRAAASRKKRVYVKLLPAGAAETAVTELKVTGKSRTLPGYLRIGEMGGFAIWCKKGPFSRPGAPPAPPPRAPSPPQRPPPRQLPLHPPNRSPTSIKRESPYDASGIYGLSAMDGVPFALHPKFEAKLNSGTNALVADLSVKSLADIDREYNYTFVVERTAAARLPPGVS